MSGRIRARAALAAVLLPALALDLIGLTWGLPAFGSWSNDDIAPLGPLKAARDLFTSFTKYPPVHYALLATLDAPYLAWLRLTGRFHDPGPEFPYGFSDPLAALTTCMLLGRLLSAAMGTATVWLVYRATVALCRDRTAGLLAACAAAFNAHVVLFAHLSNVDGPLLFWLALTVVLALRLLKRWTRAGAVRLGVCAALAAGTKDPAAGFLAGTALALLGWGARRPRRWAPLVAGAVTFLLAYAIVNNLAFGWEAFAARLDYWLGGSGTQRYVAFDASASGQVGLAGTFLGLLRDGSGWPMLIASAAGLPLAARLPRPRLALLLGGPVFYYAGSVAVVRFAYERFTLPWVLLAAPCAGMSLAWLARRGGPAGRVLVAACVGSSFVWAARVPADLLLDARYEAESHLSAHLAPGAVVETYGPEIYLPRLREMGYVIKEMDPRQVETPAFTAEALAARRPDAVVLLPNHLPRFGAEARPYADALRGGVPGYGTAVFRGGPVWLGTRRDPLDFARVNPTIWVLIRRGPESVGPP